MLTHNNPPNARVAVYLTPADVSQIEYALRTTDFGAVMCTDADEDTAKSNQLSEQFTKLAEDIDTVTL